MRARLVLISVVVVIAFAVWFVVSRATAPVETVERDARVPAPSIEHGETKLAVEDARTPASRETAAPSSSEEAANSKLLEGTTLEVLSVSKVNGAPIARVECWLTHHYLKQDEIDDALAARLAASEVPRRSDAFGRTLLSPVPGVTYQLHVRQVDPPNATNVADIAPLAKDGRATLKVELVTDADLRMFVRVLDDATGAPLAGARVSTRSDAVADDKDAKQLDLEGESGADGLAELRGFSTLSGFARVEVKGYGARYAAIQPGHDAAASAAVIRMSRGASLEVRALDADAHPVPVLIVEWVADASQLVDGGGRATATIPERRDARTDEHGIARFDDLPAGAEYAIAISRDSTLVWERASFEPLAPGAVQHLDCTVGFGAKLSGRVLDERGQPVAKQPVEIVFGEDHSSYVGAGVDDAIFDVGESDELGRYEFNGVTPGEWLVSPNLQEFSDASTSDEPVFARLAERVRVEPKTREISLDLHMRLGKWIRGTLVDANGAKVENANVKAFWETTGDTLSCACLDGSFAVGPLVDGAYSLRAASDGSPKLVGRSKVVHAGDADVVIVLEKVAKLEGRVIDASGAEAPIVHVTAWDVRGPSADSACNSDEHGRFGFDDLAPAENLLVATTSSNAIAVARVRLDAAKPAAPIELKLAPGALVNLLVPQSIAVARWELTSGENVVSKGFAHRGESKRVVVPTGKLTLAYEIAGAERRLEFELAAGETKSATLGP